MKHEKWSSNLLPCEFSALTSYDEFFCIWKELKTLKKVYFYLFQMVKRLGFGGFGKVYLLRNKTTKELRAAKHQVINYFYFY